MLQHLQPLNPPLKAMIHCVAKPPQNSKPQVVVCDLAVSSIPSYFSNIRDENRLCSTLLEKNNNPETRMNYTESFSFALPPLRLSLDKVITEKEKAGPMVVTSSPAKKTMFTTVPRPRSEKTNKTMVETTKRGYLKHRQMTVTKTLEQKVVTVFQRSVFGGRFQKVCFGISFANMEHPGHHTYNKSWQHSKKNTEHQSFCCCSLSSFMDVGQSFSL